MNQNQPNQIWLRLFPGAFAIAFLLLIFQPIDGMIGHDYYHDFSRFYIGAVHFWRHGWAVPHFTPYLCGGIPFFADPQSSYYGLPQFLTFFVDPFRASLITIANFHALGYYGFWKLSREVLGFSEGVAQLGALAFLFNGFSFAHLFVGHLTHHPYLLAPWVIYCLFVPSRRTASFLSLMLTYTFYAGGLHIVVVFATMFVLLLPYLIERHQKIMRKFCGFLGLTLILFALSVSGKVAAGFFYSANFAHREIDQFNVNPLVLLARYFWFNPLSVPLTETINGFAFGIWEYVGFLTKLTLPALAFFLFRFPYAQKKRLAIVYAVLVPVVLAEACAHGFNHELPFFRNYHNPIKLLGAFHPIFILLSAGVAESFYRRYQKSSGLVYGLILTLLFCEFGFYANFFMENKIGISFPHLPQIYTDLKAKEFSPVTKVVAKLGTDFLAPGVGFSNLGCYEPVFGYRLEAMKSTVILGAPDQIRQGRYNLNHPGCLVYPKYYQCRAWDRIRIEEKVNFTKFTAADPTAWSVPWWQSALIGLNFVVVVFSVIGLVKQQVSAEAR